MADNKTVTNTKTAFDADTNPDYVVAADEIGGANYQRIKLIHGADGVNDGDVSSVNGLPVNIVAGAASGTQYTEGDVDATITGTAMLMEGAGNALVVAQGTAADGLLVNLGTNNDVTVTGTVTANLAAGTNNIGDVDVLTVPAPLNITGGGVEASALRVTLANDSTGVLSVDDNGASLTVDGTVAATQSGTWDINNISGTIALPTGAATSANQATEITALQLIDDIVHSGDASLSKYAAIGAVYDDTTPSTVTENNAQSLRMTSARSLHVSVRDSSGDSAMDDANNALRVNVVAGGAGDGAILDGVSGSIKATVLDYTNSNPLAVRLTDTSGDYVGAGAGTQYTEDDASAANPIGTQVIARRRDSLATETTTDGDVTAVNSTAKGELYVKHVDSIPVTDNGGSLTVDGTVTANLAAGTNNIGDVDVLTVPAPLNVTGGGVEASALRVTIANDSTGVLSVDDNGGSLTIDAASLPLPTGAATLAEQQTQTTALQLIDDTVTTLGTDTYTEAASKGLTIGAVRRDADTTLVNTTNEFGPLQMDANGRLKVEIFDGGDSHTVDGTVAATQSGAWIISANSGVDIGDVTINNASGGAAVNIQDGGNSITVDNAGTFAAQIEGDIDHDSADSGTSAPVKIGGVAVSGSASPTSVTASDRTRWIFNQHGIPYMIGGHPNLITREYDFGTAAQTDVNLAAVAVAADERIYVTRFEATCDNANTVAVSVRAGFGTATVPAASATGVSGMIASHPGIAAGSGIVSGNGAGLIAVGGAGEEPRLTSSAATSGNLHVIISYFLIDETP